MSQPQPISGAESTSLGGEGITQGATIQNPLPSPLDYDGDGYPDYVEENSEYMTDPANPSSYPRVPLAEAIDAAHADYVSHVNAGTMEHWYSVPQANAYYAARGAGHYGAGRIPYKAIGIGAGVVAAGAVVAIAIGGGSSDGSDGTSVGSEGGTAHIFINAKDRDQGTGVVLSAGQRFSIQASGSVNAGSGYGTWGPDGAGPSGSPNDTFTGGNAFSLIGKIGNTGYFTVGSSYSGISPTTGELRLMMNDSLYTDNSGGWSVTIVTQPHP